MLEVIQKKITEAFDIFDHESNKTVAITYDSESILCIKIHKTLVEILDLDFIRECKRLS